MKEILVPVDVHFEKEEKCILLANSQHKAWLSLCLKTPLATPNSNSFIGSTTPDTGCAYLWLSLWIVLVLWYCFSQYEGIHYTVALVPNPAAYKMSLAFSSYWLYLHYHPFSVTHRTIS